METFEIIIGISTSGKHFKNVSPQNRNWLTRQISEIMFSNQLDFLRIE